ncbi:MAG: serine hydrolase [Bacteriovoracaceae bacterium]|nr:serine hydrolase [Bacteriovoracaceae bacterium]
MEIVKSYLENHDIDAIGIGIIDFSLKSFKSKTLLKNDNDIIQDDSIYFDLASLTKVLTNGTFYLKFLDQMDEDLRLLVEHRASLPAWGYLSKSTWKEDLKKYSISSSETLYSDYSALRFMLDAQGKTKKNMYDEVREYHDEVIFWKNLKNQKTVQNGFVKQKRNFKNVHDPNSYNINEFTSHAGLFGTTSGLCKTLLNINKELDALKIIKENKTDNRFTFGWDTISSPDTTLAGSGCGEFTFGHLGFTGTSVWIDPDLNLGHVILTNSTKNFWYDKKDLNNFRKKIGSATWKKELTI